MPYWLIILRNDPCSSQVPIISRGSADLLDKLRTVADSDAASVEVVTKSIYKTHCTVVEMNRGDSARSRLIWFEIAVHHIHKIWLRQISTSIFTNHCSFSTFVYFVIADISITSFKTKQKYLNYETPSTSTQRITHNTVNITSTQKGQDF